MEDNTYELTPIEREYIDGLSVTQKRVEAEMMGALAIVCKQHGLDPNRSVYRNGVLTGIGPQNLPVAIPTMAVPPIVSDSQSNRSPIVSDSQNTMQITPIQSNAAD